MPDTFSRREALGALTLAGAALALNPRTALGQPATAPAPAPRRRVLRLAHLTDTHIQPERKGDQGLAACLRHVMAQDPKPDLILAGGDQVMDAFEHDSTRSGQLFDLWNRIRADGTDLPILHAIGNHDIWGWNKRKSKATGDEPRWGKAWAVESFALPARYYSTDRAGWHFIVLDSVHTDPADASGYIGQLDDEQHAWLIQDLARTPRETPVLVLSHIPIVTSTVLFDHQDDVAIKREIPAGLMHTDAKRLVKLFRKHGNVRLALSGHIHLVDRVDLHGTSYLCNGAVSGAWWKGLNDDCAEGYALVDLFDDGSFESRYLAYGWTPHPA